MSQSVKLINSGKPAMEIVARTLKLSQPAIWPSAFGPVELRPGQIWAGNKMLIMVQGSTTYSTIDDRLYEWSTSDFIRDEWIRAQQKAMASAQGWVVIAQIEMALLCGIFVPWYLMLGLTCAKTGLFYASNKDDVHEAMDKGGKVLEKLQKFRRDQPKFYRLLRDKVLRELLSELGNGVSGEDVAFFIGRVIRGVAGSAVDVTLKLFLRIVIQTATIVAVTHSPNIVLHAAQSAAQKSADELAAFLRSIGYTVTAEEAKGIVNEMRSTPMSARNLKDLETDLRALLPSLDRLKKAQGLL